MSDSFSSGIKFSPGDLNDFLLPSEQCVLPLQKKLEPKVNLPKKMVLRDSNNRQHEPVNTLKARPNRSPGTKANDNSHEKHETTTDSMRRDNNRTLPDEDSRTAKTRDSMLTNISLSDCLSCSGCLTSSEEILLGKHSSSLLRNMSENPHVAVVVSLSPHLWAKSCAQN